jgi:hypothetical protein
MAANLGTSALHYADNVARFQQYPEPTWLSAPLVAALWFVVTAIGLTGWSLSRREHRAARPLLLLYALLGLAVLGHYLVHASKPMDGAMHALILLEATAAAALLAFLWSSRPVAN